MGVNQSNTLRNFTLQPPIGHSLDMNILVVDDAPDDLDRLKTILDEVRCWNIVCAKSTAEALRAMASREIGLVLADIMNPDTGGLEACRLIKVRPDLRDTPVVMVMGASEREYVNPAYEAGACDYIIRPLDPVEVVARVRSVLRSSEETGRRRARESHLEALTRELRAANQQLRELSVVDTVTGVANRRCFDEMLDRAWRSAARHQFELALLMIDVDCFKAYNDRLGHPAGDKCLRQVARELTDGLMRPDDFLARYGGEEFAVILPRTDLRGAGVVAEKLRSNVESLGILHPASPASEHVTISQGMACALPAPLSAPSSLIALADQALYDAKRSGRNKVCGQPPALNRRLFGFVAQPSQNRTPHSGELASPHAKAR